jgi:hypothetical protein
MNINRIKKQLTCVRINCSLCGVKMFDLHLCLSASVNVRYILHTQPLGLYIIKY